MEHNFSEAMANLSDLIEQKQDFVIIGLSGKLTETAEHVEKAIEATGMSCRVYTKHRVYAALAASLVPWVGLAAVGSLVAHRLATQNPDFELEKDIGKNKLYVNYKK